MTSSAPTRLARVLAIAALVGTFVACGGGGDDDADASGSTAPPSTVAPEVPQDLVDAAEEEGKLVWYGAEVETVLDYTVQQFESIYDIDVEVYRASSAPLLQRYTAERDGGGTSADVVSAADVGFFADDDGTYLAPLDAETVPAVADYPDDALSEYAATLSITPWGVGYNTSLVSEDELPDDWDGFASDEWKDKVLLSDARTTGSFTAFYDFLEDTYGPDTIRGIAAQGEVVSETTSGGQQLAAGTAAVMFPLHAPVVNGLKGEGAPIAIKYYDDTTGFPMLSGISNDAANPNAAALFMNFLLSDAGQVAFTGHSGAISPLGDDIEGSIPRPADFVDSDFAGALEPDRSQELFGLLGLS